MKLPVVIDFERAGGYAGLTLRTTIDSHSLPANEKEELGRLLDESGIHELMQKSVLPESLPDQFIYRLKIHWGEELLSIQLGEKEIPPSVRPLLKFLTNRSLFKKNHKSK
jgi:Emfourin